MNTRLQSPPMANTQHRYVIPIMIAVGAFMFSSKGILVKLLYAEGLTPIGVLAIRMGVAIPFYTIPLLIHGRKLFALASRKDWVIMMGLAFVGYFLCSWINFSGLQYISVGLERVIMFCYPSLVLIGAAVFQKQRPTKVLVTACCLSWIGLYLVLKNEIHLGENPQWILIGSGMVLTSAIIYASYILVAKPVINRVGSHLYTNITMCFSCIFILVTSCFSENYSVGFEVTSDVIVYGVVIGVFGTVVPTYILSYGLAKMKPTAYAVVSSAGPVGTILLSMALVGAQPTFLQAIGVVCSIAGCLLASRK